MPLMPPSALWVLGDFQYAKGETSFPKRLLRGYTLPHHPIMLTYIHTSVHTLVYLHTYIYGYAHMYFTDVLL